MNQPLEDLYIISFLQNVEFNFDDMVKPAPVQKRPLEIIYNPYPTSCSKFCNHPIDRDLRQEYKDVIRKAKEGIVSILNLNPIMGRPFSSHKKPLH